MPGILQAQDPQNPEQMNAQGRQPMPEEAPKDAQDNYDQFAANAINVVHQKSFNALVEKRVVNSDEPVTEIGSLAFETISRLELSAQGNNLEMYASTLVQGLKLIIEEIITIAEAEGLEPLNDEEKYQAFSWAFGNYLDKAVKTGKITKEELTELGETLNERMGEVDPEKAQGVISAFSKPTAQPNPPEAALMQPQTGGV